jgi:hypothetical protein
MTFVNGEVQARFMARIRGVDPQRCLAIPVDVGKATAVALVADHYGEIIVAPFEFALTEAGFADLDPEAAFLIAVTGPRSPSISASHCSKSYRRYSVRVAAEVSPS